MGAYSYKDVVYRGDFNAAIKPAMEAIGRAPDDYDGDANYNGDGWVVAAFLLEQKDAELAAERERADRAEAELGVLRDNQLGPVPEGPLKALGAWIADHTDEDEWLAAERFLNAALAEMQVMRADAEIGRRWSRDSSLKKWFPYTAEEIHRLRLDEARINKLAHMAVRQKVSIADTGVIPYRICLNGAVLGNSLREVIDKAIIYPPMEAP